MSGAHTPGPWAVSEINGTGGIDDLYIFIEPSVAIIERCVKGFDKHDLPNAKLLAAAPDLLEALEMVRDADEDCRKDGLRTIPAAARARIEAALAKAAP